MIIHFHSQPRAPSPKASFTSPAPPRELAQFPPNASFKTHKQNNRKTLYKNKEQTEKQKQQKIQK